MSVAGIMLVKDEADVLSDTVRHLRSQVDHLIILDNESTDGTRELLDALQVEFGPDWLDVREDRELGYYQSQKISMVAAGCGYSWVVPCDADEVWYSTFGRVGDILDEMPRHVGIVDAELYDHVVTGADDEMVGPPFRRIRWRRREPGALPKVACRVLPGLVVEQGNHGAHYPGRVQRFPNALTIRHFPYRSVDQMVQKVRNGAAAYAATSLPPEVGRHWREYGQLLEAYGPAAVEEIFLEWFYVEEPGSDPSLIFDPAPL